MTLTSRGWIPRGEAAVAAHAAALGAWLLHPSLVWAGMAFVLGAAAALLVVRSRRPLLLGAAAIGLVGATTAGVTSGRVRMVEQRWMDVREQLLKGAIRQLAATLEST